MPAPQAETTEPQLLQEVSRWVVGVVRQLFFNLTAIRKRQVFSNVSHDCPHHLLSRRVLPHRLHNHRILHERCMSRNVCVMILIDKRLRRFSPQERHVLTDRITRCHVVINRHELLSILHTQHFNHLPMQNWKVVNLRCLSRQLHYSLILHDALSHRRTIGITDRYNFNHVVICLHRLWITCYWVVVVARGRVISNDVLKELELLFH